MNVNISDPKQMNAIIFGKRYLGLLSGLDVNIVAPWSLLAPSTGSSVSVTGRMERHGLVITVSSAGNSVRT